MVLKGMQLQKLLQNHTEALKKKFFFNLKFSAIKIYSFEPISKYSGKRLLAPQSSNFKSRIHLSSRPLFDPSSRFESNRESPALIDCTLRQNIGIITSRIELNACFPIIIIAN